MENRLTERSDDRRLLRSYVLGFLSEEEEQGVEVRVLREEHFSIALELSEDDLIEEYANGALTSKERAAFEQRVLSTHHGRSKLRLHRILDDYAAGLPPGRYHTTIPEEEFAVPNTRWSWSYLAAAAVLLILLGGLAFSTWSWRTLRSELEGSLAQYREDRDALDHQLELERRGRQDLEQQLARLTIHSPLPIAVLDIDRDQFRSEGRTPVLTTGDSWVAELRLEVGDLPFQDYSATLFRTTENQRLLMLDRLLPVAGGATIRVSVKVPASLVSPGDYHIELSGRTADGNVEPVGTYPFRVPG